MKINGICFSKTGAELAEKLRIMFETDSEFADTESSWVCKSTHGGPDAAMTQIKPLGGSLHEWTESHFHDSDAMIFIAASGIAVRAIAPFVMDKRSDPAVIVLDEKGTYCIALLSGHIGGANALVRQISEKIGSTPVITTATDIHNKFAVDVYARERCLTLSNMTYAKEVSAAVIGGEPVGFYTPFPTVGELPEGLVWSEKLLQEIEADKERAGGISLGICISPSYSRAHFDHTLWLIPQCLTIGIGCRKDTKADAIEDVIKEALDRQCLYQEAILQIASIDLKAEEKGLVTCCKRLDVPLITYSADELKAVTGDFSRSAFVEDITGVDNVCERAAVLASKGHLIINKISREGVTCAVAISDYRVEF